MRRKASGFMNSRPQPSPDRPSAAIAPRCIMQASELIALRTRAWLA
jgi:hypothetical protein